MSLTQSTMRELGTPAADFSLPEPLTGKSITLADFTGKPALLVVFLCNHCPYVKHINRALAALIREYQPRGLAAVAINANDPDTYPDDSPARMIDESRRLDYSFPYLFDATQTVAKAYHAACTPDFFLFDAHQRLAYRGQFDAARPGNAAPVTGADLRAAIEAVLAGRSIPADSQRPSIGCNIKWRENNSPDYFA